MVGHVSSSNMFQRFLHSQVFGALILIATTIVALGWANSQWGQLYYDISHTYVGIKFGELEFKMTLSHWIKDGLMAIFFFVVGLEIKREILDGELQSLRAASLPILAAVGGMVKQYQVVIDPELHVLLDVVEQFKGLHSSLEKLLYEVCHPFRNWKIILPQLRSYTVKNIHRYRTHEKGPESFQLFAGLYLEALEETGRDATLLAQVVGAMMVWLEKFIGSCSSSDLERFGPEFNALFTQLVGLEAHSPAIFMQIVHGQHPVRKIARRFVQVTGKDAARVDFSPMARLMQTVLGRCYTYWLREDDPLTWFLDRCSIPVTDFHSSQLFRSISHEVMEEHLNTLYSLDLKGDPLGSLTAMFGLPDHIDIVK